MNSKKLKKDFPSLHTITRQCALHCKGEKISGMQERHHRSERSFKRRKKGRKAIPKVPPAPDGTPKKKNPEERILPKHPPYIQLRESRRGSQVSIQKSTDGKDSALLMEEFQDL